MCYWNKYIRSSWRSFCPRPTNIVRLSEFLILSIRLKEQTSQGNQTVKLKLNKLNSQKKQDEFSNLMQQKNKIVKFNSSIRSDNLQNKLRSVQFDQSFLPLKLHGLTHHINLILTLSWLSRRELTGFWISKNVYLNPNQLWSNQFGAMVRY